jgi:hypothetical protein
MGNPRLFVHRIQNQDDMWHIWIEYCIYGYMDMDMDIVNSSTCIILYIWIWIKTHKTYWPPFSDVYTHTSKKDKLVCPPPNTQHHRQTIRIYRISNSSSNIKMCPILKIYNDIWGWVYPICGVVEKGKWHVNICMFRPNQSYCYGLLITYPGKCSMTMSLYPITLRLVSHCPIKYGVFYSSTSKKTWRFHYKPWFRIYAWVPMNIPFIMLGCFNL